MCVCLFPSHPDCEDYIQNGEYTPEIDELSDDQTAGSAYSLCVWEGCSESHALICAYGESGAIRKLFLETDDDGNIEYIQNIWIQSADASPDADIHNTPIAFESTWVTVDDFLEMYGPDSENDNGDDNGDDNDDDNDDDNSDDNDNVNVNDDDNDNDNN